MQVFIWKSKLYVFGFLFFLASFSAEHSSFAQLAVPDFSLMNVEEMSDEQIQDLLIQAKEMGYSQSDLLQLAQSQGVSIEELTALKKRMTGLGSGRVAEGSKRPGLRVREQTDSDLITPTVSMGEESPASTRIFGHALFYNPGIRHTFEPSLNLPTPKNYILGTGDELYIDIYGASEQYYETQVSSDGKILLENIGPIPVGGISIEQATQRIENKLATVYNGIKSATPNTFVAVSLGSVRTIKVNLAGEVIMPGTYTISSLATVFNLLYSAGGVTNNGTLRNIKVYRANKLIGVVDAYDFLVSGISSDNVRLEDQDVIIVGPYTERVEIKGEVKIPAVFELKGEETFEEVLQYAGGFTDQAYTERINVVRNSGSQKLVADIYKDQLGIFEPKGGDVYTVGRILDRFTNRIQLKGAVYRQGNFALTEGLTLKNLIARAEGLTGDAYLERALIIRTNPDLTTYTIPFNLDRVMKGSEEDIVLQREDIIHIFSKYDLKEEYYVSVSGEVNREGVFPYSYNMTVEDILMLANGLRESASESNIEITRRVKDQNSNDISDIILLSVDRDLNLSEDEKGIVLEPFDHVIVRRNPNFRTERFVRVEGEVFYPGQYAITNVNERISDVIKRTGGLNQFAYPKGASLIRRTEFFTDEPEVDKKIKSLQQVRNKVAQSGTDSESQNLLLGRIDREVSQDTGTSDENSDLTNFARKERLAELTGSDDLVSGVALKGTEIIGINLEEIIKKPGSKYDLILEEGDVISIPKQLQTVRVRGQVLYPTTSRYESGKSARYFINRAGGFGNRAKRRSTYVLYANGDIARTHSFLFFKSYPTIEPGAEVIVPVKPLKIPLRPGEIIGLTSGLATLALLISQIQF